MRGVEIDEVWSQIKGQLKSQRSTYMYRSKVNLKVKGQPKGQRSIESSSIIDFYSWRREEKENNL